MALPAGTTVINGFALTPDGALYVTPDPAAAFSGTVVTASTAFRAPDGTISAPGYGFTSATNSGWYLGGTLLRATIGGVNSFGISSTAIFSGAGAGLTDLGGPTVSFKRLYLDYTNTGTVGNVTINKASGRVNLAAAGTTLTLTNSLITAASKVFLNADNAPGNVVAVQLYAVAGAGSCTINAVPAVTNQTAIDFLVINAD